MSERFYPTAAELPLTEHDPGSWGASLLYNAELVIELLDAADARSVLEVGARDGDLTRLLLQWAAPLEATVTAVDPSPQTALESLAAERPELRLVRERSHVALGETLADVVILDGDHNHWTVTGELEALRSHAEAEGRALPVVLAHDVGWPHGRRDDYFDPAQIPAEHRRPVAPEGALHPGEPGTREGGLPFHHPAAREGGEGNGVLTALERFVADRPSLALTVVPTFFGLGVVYDSSLPQAVALAEVLADLDRNPYLQRLEGNRVRHLVETQRQLAVNAAAQRRLVEQGRALDRRRALLQAMERSRTVRVVEWVLSRRHPDPPISRAAIARALGAGEG